ncbi:NADP-dependent oxidoreductase [Microbacterium gorillae]|uniref:NADP-dependent oxidoreductase n=1 Tax=Microbacterium gorillae TaxID=1231063 RepID=UPI0006933A6F|nr:NADP-dependent oxidoreductase [Microbacterium gorillae]
MTSARIAVARSFGPPEVIKIEEHPVPDPAPGQVQVAVRFSGTNPVDARIRAGRFGGRPPLVFGREFSGTVIRSRDPRFAVGDAVMGAGVQGASADLIVVDAERLVHKPESLDWATAGGLLSVGQTALTVLDDLNLPVGSILLIHGASGGVGTALIQLAVDRGLTVIGTASPANHDHLRRLGARPVAYGPGLAERIEEATGGAPVDASVDLAGTTEAGDIAAAVARAGGIAVTLVPETMSSHGLRLISSRQSPERAAALVAAADAGALVLPVEVLPFTEIVEAHRRMDAGHSRGKLVLENADNPYLTSL